MPCASGCTASRSPAHAPEQVAPALADPKRLDLPFASRPLDRLAAYCNGRTGSAIKRRRIDRSLLAEGLRWRRHETWCGERADPAFAGKSGGSRRSSRAARRRPGRLPGRDGPGGRPDLARSSPRSGRRSPGRAKLEIGCGRRGRGYIRGAFRPAPGDAFLWPCLGRRSARWVAFLEEVELWRPGPGGSARSPAT